MNITARTISGSTVPIEQDSDPKYLRSNQQQEEALDHFSCLPLDLHRIILGFTGAESLLRLREVSPYFKSLAEDPLVQDPYRALFPLQYAPLAKWEQILLAGAGVNHKLSPSDVLLALQQTKLRLINPTGVKIVVKARRDFISEQGAVLMRSSTSIGYVQLKPSGNREHKRLIGINDQGGNLIGFGSIADIHRKYQIQTFIASPKGLIEEPKLLEKLKNQTLRLGDEYFRVFTIRNTEGSTIDLMQVPPELEKCRALISSHLASRS